MAFVSSPPFALQDTDSKPCDAESAERVTLLIKHLPEAIPHDTLYRIFTNFGAFSVRPCSSASVSIVSTFWLGYTFGLVDEAVNPTGGAVCHICSNNCIVPYILNMDLFDPIADNARGIIEMSGQRISAQGMTNVLDAIGTEPKLPPKDLLSVLLLLHLSFSAYMDECLGLFVYCTRGVLAIISPIVVALLFQILGYYTDCHIVKAKIMASLLMFAILSGLQGFIWLKNSAFVDFKNEIMASQAQRQLNGLRFLGKVLSAERANNLTGEKSSEDQLGKDSKTSMLKNANLTKPIDGDTKSRGLPVPEPIADRLGVNYPFPPHLEYAAASYFEVLVSICCLIAKSNARYAYPPPDGNILTNIVNALIAVPRFYTQVVQALLEAAKEFLVLHLMNKMNIPAPFRMALPTPPLPPEAPVPPPPPTVTANPQSSDLSSSESEMESSEEEYEANTKRSGQKRARHETIVGPAIDKGVAHESVGVKPATLVPKEIPIIKKNHVLKINIVPKSTVNEHKYDETSQELQEPEKDVPNPNKFLTAEELEKGKLPPEEILSLPMFKNYTAGNPAPVLYVKNLAKDVIADDFYFIFGTLFGSVEAAKFGLQVKLMQEGRMRGQAFLTFPSIELAHHALNLVNGYVLKGKPMIIQFGRNPAAAKAT
ncbi:unnamed protein product [Sphenostylis stenocarpa]|uniref:H(+)-exporting diphosphatase n=1 Tax=Sphenostylis stenocarpa TaxID=92480 RepID=A0AA86RL83_9FABA|nr:unnamed protein product [Sphenostylis stenocarpa]